MADQVREAFLRWAKDNGFNVDARFENVGKLSQFLATEHAWQGWQAATASHAADVEALTKAAQRLCRSFPTDDDMAAAGWGRAEIDEACNAYDALRAALKGDKP